MSDNPEFDKALDERYGEGFATSLQCAQCGADRIECHNCHESICKEGCEEKR